MSSTRRRDGEREVQALGDYDVFSYQDRASGPYPLSRSCLRTALGLAAQQNCWRNWTQYVQRQEKSLSHGKTGSDKSLIAAIIVSDQIPSPGASPLIRWGEQQSTYPVPPTIVVQPASRQP